MMHIHCSLSTEQKRTMVFRIIGGVFRIIGGGVQNNRWEG